MGRRAKKGLRGLLLIAVATSVPFSAFGQQDERLDDVTEDVKELTTAETQTGPGLLIAPIPVSEPVLGTGLGIGAMRFFQPRGSGPHSSYVGVVGGATSNGSWLVGAINSMKLKHDTIRIESRIGYGDINEIYFGSSGDLSPGIDYNQRKFVLRLAPRFRMGDSDWFVGGEYRFESTNTTLIDDVPDSERGDDNTPIDGTQRIGGLTALAALDARDNLYSAQSGELLEFRVGTYQPWLGSSNSFSKAKFEYRRYHALDPKTALAARAVSEAITGDEAPFFEQPYLQIRGYARGEIRNDVTLWAEAEARRDLFWKLGAVAFVGAGWAAERYSDIFSSSGKVGAGLGLRYTLRPDDRLKIGVDIAWSADNNGLFYLRVGEAF